MKRCIIFFVLLVAMLILAIITGYNEPEILENQIVIEASEEQNKGFEQVAR